MTLRDALTLAASELEQNAGLRGSALRDATLLLRHSLNISRASLVANPERIVTVAEQVAYRALVRRRLTNEPIQYITGEQEFYGLTLRVTPAVLIPRAETEHLVEAVLSELRSHPPGSPCILDVGTGSGAIAIALAHSLPNTLVTAVDLSPAALEVARANAAHHHLPARIRFLESDLLAALAESQTFDAIVSNPPYVATADRDALHPQVRDFEPPTAFFAGPDGLDVYRRLIPQASAALKPGGLLTLEIGHGQRDAVAALLAGWNAVHFIDDLQHIPRVALARKP
jgi:release factor glutamine methyltransferase